MMQVGLLYFNMVLIMLIQQCHSQTDRCLCRKELENQVRRYLASSIERYSSCAEIRAARPLSPSGVYTLHYENQTSEEVYCLMGTLPGCGEGGWRRLGYLDMTDPDQNCPSQLPIEFNVEGNIRSCTYSGNSICASLFFSTNGRNYTRVCASVRGYAVGDMDSFTRFGNPNLRGIDQPYLDGVSFTYGSPRKHLWSYAAGFFCPAPGCNMYDIVTAGITIENPPSFVGDNYYCEEGQTPSDRTDGNGEILWDGNCSPTETQNGCCDTPYLPWFHRTIPITTEQVEMRACRDEDTNTEHGPLDQYQIYVQ